MCINLFILSVDGNTYVFSSVEFDYKNHILYGLVVSFEYSGHIRNENKMLTNKKAAAAAAVQHDGTKKKTIPNNSLMFVSICSIVLLHYFDSIKYWILSKDNNSKLNRNCMDIWNIVFKQEIRSMWCRVYAIYVCAIPWSISSVHWNK